MAANRSVRLREDRKCVGCGVAINVRKDKPTSRCGSCARSVAGQAGGRWSPLPAGEALARKRARRHQAKIDLRAARATRRRTLFVAGVCPGCVGPFVMPWPSDGGSPPRYCSPPCRSRARNKGKARPPISPAQRRRVFERDGWRCGICSGAIDPALRWPDVGCAVVDHVVPLAAGGAHDPDNWQAAHNQCNADKADSYEVV